LEVLLGGKYERRIEVDAGEAPLTALSPAVVAATMLASRLNPMTAVGFLMVKWLSQDMSSRNHN
jgi:hypothetical protein